ncbi:hypothetical protein C8Q73DRAFT_796347 [Cubamyces lactineus]|nr:hypothetical protein C8Q73DRAFT_796347 [Cubamyces lactineus]
MPISIWKRLTGGYAQAEMEKDHVGMAAIVGVMTMLSVDAGLRDRLLEKGMLQKIMPLVEHTITRRLALQAMAIIAQHSNLNESVLEVISRHNRTLVRVMEEYPDDLKVAGYVIKTTSRTAKAVVKCNDSQPSDPLPIQEASVPLVLDATIDALHRSVHSLKPNIPDPIDQQYRQCTELMPTHLQTLLEDYGIEHTETWATLSARQDFLIALSQAKEDRDMYALGKKLAKVIQRAVHVEEEDFQEALNQVGWQLAQDPSAHRGRSISLCSCFAY